MKQLVLHSVVPVRREDKETAEQTTQLLFGETCEVLDQTDRWLKITNETDGQQGWVDKKMLSPISEEEYKSYISSDRSALVCYPMAYAVSEGNNQTFPLTAGTRLANYNNGHFSILGASFRIDPAMVSTPKQLTAESLQHTARFFLNIPYLWGGKNCLGMDCSGFVQVLMSLFGKQLPRNASEQAKIGEEIGFLQESQAGDLVFFDHHTAKTDSTNICHVGILLSQDTVMHCSGRVKVEHIDSNGIISQQTGEYTHDLRVIKRF